MPTLGHTLGFVFSGDTFSVDYAEYEEGVIYLTYSVAPKATDPTATDDALNPNSYTLTGPTINGITAVASTADPTIFALTVRYRLGTGYWKIQVGSLVASADLIYTIGSPDSWVLYFEAAATEGANPGAENDEDLLTPFLNPAFAYKPNWKKFMEVLSAGEALVLENYRLAYDQLFVASASGKYLTQRGTDRGLSRFEDVGLTDDNYRTYVTRVSNRQLTEQAVLGALEVFYGTDSVRATSVSALGQPYNIPDGYTLELLLDEKTSVTVPFFDSDWGLPGYATAQEVAGVITRWLKNNESDSFALPYRDPETGEYKVKLYSAGLGLGSAIRVTGGLAQNLLEFPSKIDIYTADPLPQWVVTYDSVTGITRYTAQGVGLAVNPNLTLLKIGDYVNVTGEFNEDNHGSFSITDLGVEYTFEATPQTVLWFEYQGVSTPETITQLLESSLVFYSPTKSITYTNSTTSVMVADLGDRLDVILPATSPAVSREPYRAAYLVDPDIKDVESFSIKDGVATVTSTAHGLSIGDRVLVELLPDADIPATTAAGAGTSAARQTTVWSTTSNLIGGQSVFGFAGKVSDTQGVVGYGLSVATETVTLKSAWEDLALTTAEAGGLRTSSYTRTAVAGPTARAHPGAVTSPAKWQNIVTEPSIFVTGGWISTAGIYSTTNTSHWYLATSKAYSTNSDLLTYARAGHVALVDSDYAWVFGGMGDWQRTGSSGADQRSPEYYDIANPSQWNAATAETTGRFEAAGCRTSDGKYLISGGRPLAEGPYQDKSTGAIWRLDDSTVSPTGTGSASSTLTGSTVSFVNATYNPNSKNGLRCTAAGSLISKVTPTTELRDIFTARSYSVEGWWYYEGTTPSRDFFTIVNAGLTTFYFAFGTDPSDPTKFNIYWDAMLTAGCVSSFTITYYNTRKWNHWCVTVEPNSNAAKVNVKLYINGILRQTWTSVNKPVTSNPDGNLYLGKYYTGTAGNYGMSQIRVCDYTLSRHDVWRSYQQSTGEVLWNVPYYSSPSPLSDAVLEKARWAAIGVVHSGCSLYDPVGDTWSVSGDMAYSRFGHSLALLSTGEILAVGGIGYKATQSTYFDPVTSSPVHRVLNECEIWSPTSGRWRPAGRLPAGAGGYVTTETVGDDVYIFGSVDGYCYRYNVPTRKFHRVAEVNQAGISGQKSIALGTTIASVGGVKLSESGVIPDTTSQTLDLLVLNSQKSFQGNLERLATIESTTTNTFTFSDPDYPDYTVGSAGSAIVTSATARATNHQFGPYVLDPEAGFAHTSYQTTTTNPLVKSRTYNQITLTYIANFPESGWLVFGFGTKNQVGPLRYYTKVDDNTMVVDSGFIFTKDVAAGSTVDYVNQSEFYDPDGLDLGVFYLTDSPSGRAAAQSVTEDIVGVGINTNIQIAYGSDRGIGAEGSETSGSGKLSDIVGVFSHKDDK